MWHESSFASRSLPICRRESNILQFILRLLWDSTWGVFLLYVCSDLFKPTFPKTWANLKHFWLSIQAIDRKYHVQIWKMSCQRFRRKQMVGENSHYKSATFLNQSRFVYRFALKFNKTKSLVQFWTPFEEILVTLPVYLPGSRIKALWNQYTLYSKGTGVFLTSCPRPVLWFL